MAWNIIFEVDGSLFFNILWQYFGFVSCSSLIHVDGKAIHVGYLQLGQNLLVLLLPAARFVVYDSAAGIHHFKVTFEVLLCFITVFVFKKT